LGRSRRARSPIEAGPLLRARSCGCAASIGEALPREVKTMKRSLPLLALSLSLALPSTARAQTWSLLGPQSQDFFGFSVAPAGDVNGDGYSDILVGAPHYAVAGSQVGRVYLFLGSATGPKQPAARVYTGEQADDAFGISVAAAGDVNGDG